MILIIFTYYKHILFFLLIFNNNLVNNDNCYVFVLLKVLKILKIFIYSSFIDFFFYLILLKKYFERYIFFNNKKITIFYTRFYIHIQWKKMKNKTLIIIIMIKPNFNHNIIFLKVNIIMNFL